MKKGTHTKTEGIITALPPSPKPLGAEVLISSSLSLKAAIILSKMDYLGHLELSVHSLTASPKE